MASGDPSREARRRIRRHRTGGIISVRLHKSPKTLGGELIEGVDPEETRVLNSGPDLRGPSWARDSTALSSNREMNRAWSFNHGHAHPCPIHTADVPCPLTFAASYHSKTSPKSFFLPLSDDPLHAAHGSQSAAPTHLVN